MTFILLFVCSYLIGSIPFGLIIGILFFSTDIRNKGSGNIGATNSLRTFGKKAGASVFILDALKGVLSAFLCLWILPLEWACLAVLGVVLGHCYSIFLNFSGGKAISTNFGVVIAFHPMIALFGLLCFIFVLKTSRYVSIASVSSAIFMLLGSIFTQPIQFTLLLLIASLIIIIKHMPNFKRIRLKTEPKIKNG